MGIGTLTIGFGGGFSFFFCSPAAMPSCFLSPFVSASTDAVASVDPSSTTFFEPSAFFITVLARARLFFLVFSPFFDFPDLFVEVLWLFSSHVSSKSLSL